MTILLGRTNEIAMLHAALVSWVSLDFKPSMEGAQWSWNKNPFASCWHQYLVYQKISYIQPACDHISLDTYVIAVSSSDLLLCKAVIRRGFSCDMMTLSMYHSYHSVIIVSVPHHLVVSRVVTWSMHFTKNSFWFFLRPILPYSFSLGTIHWRAVVSGLLQLNMLSLSPLVYSCWVQSATNSSTSPGPW